MLKPQESLTELTSAASSESLRLMQFSPAGGCGCKLAPSAVADLIRSNSGTSTFPGLVVGNSDMDDAAVLSLENGKGLLATVDFFTPVVDDPFEFGRIAAANAVSDIYAMGGHPLLAVAILGWPVERIGLDAAKSILRGARSICDALMVPLAGGHSIRASEPFFGLSVNGLIDLNHVKRNSGARVGDYLFVTKALGTGVLSTAIKRNLINDDDYQAALEVMTKVNVIGTALGKISAVSTMTDISGFGLLGHIAEICMASNVGVELCFAQLPVLSGVRFYLEQGCETSGGKQNWAAYQPLTSTLTDFERAVLCDPQTNGGLLIAVNPSHVSEVEELIAGDEAELLLAPVGRVVMRTAEDCMITVIDSLHL